MNEGCSARGLRSWRVLATLKAHDAYILTTVSAGVGIRRGSEGVVRLSNGHCLCHPACGANRHESVCH